MTTAFGTPFLLQERTLYSISDYQTGRCMSALRGAITIDRTNELGPCTLPPIFQYNRIAQATPVQ